jgi:tRNA A37 methylthiotransferase MiaB
VNGRVARERSREIRAVVAAKREDFLASQVGRCLPALTLGELEDGARVALTTNYVKVVLPGAEIPANRLVNVWIGRASAGKLYGYTRQLA